MATANQVSQLFVALYNRAIDATTAQKYSGQAYNAQLVNNIIADNGGVTETGRAFIERLYKNALGKNPSDDLDGINYWTSLAEGKQFNETTGIFEQTASQQPLSRGDTVLSFLSSVNAWSTDGAMQRPAYMNESQWATHSALARAGADVFGGKVTISNQAATRVGGDAGAANLTFDGAGGLESITKDNYKSAIENNLAKIEGLALRYPATTTGGNSITLSSPNQTSALPTAPDNAPEGYVATTAADDSIYASIPQSGAAGAPTLQATTNIDAGAGYDTLYVDMGNSFEGFNTVNAGIKGVEKIVLTNTTHNENISFNALGIKDVYTYSIKGSNGINLQNIDYNEYLLIELDGVANTMPAAGGNTQTGGVTSLTFNNRPAGGNLNLSLKNVGAASDDTGRNNHTVQFGIGTGSYIGNADGSVLSGIQMLNLAVSGRNYVDIANSGVTRITVTGTGDLDTNLSEGVNYFNAAAAAGNLIVRATDPKTGGNNATGVFDYFSTGEGNDKVVIDVSRLSQNAVVDLGADKYDPTTGNGGDRLTLVGQVDNVARTNTYNFNTIEHLVFNTTTKNAGDALLINLGTVSEEQEVGTEEVPQPDGTTKTESVMGNVQIADRSADLKTITFQDAANVRLTGLGEKNLSVIYNGATEGQDVLVDTKGTVNLTLNGADTDNGDNTTGDANGKLGQGIVNLSNAKTVNLDLTGQGFEGFLKFDNAETLNITNYTGDKKLKLKPNEANGNGNHLSSVKNLTIDTTAKGDNTGSQALDDSVDLRAATLPSLTNATLIGVGGIQFGDIDTRNALKFDGSQYSGRLLLGNVSAKQGTSDIYGENAGTLSIVTKGAITTGTLTGTNVTIDLKHNIETADGLYNNNIGNIVLNGETATLTYITGFSGTVYQEKTTSSGGSESIRTISDTQAIQVDAVNATITLDGLTGTDKFDIVAGFATKELTINGSLGSANEEQKATGNYDSVRIDLSNASGIKLDIANLQLDNPNVGQGIVIAASKGQDTLTLSRLADVVEFSAGGAVGAVSETYTVDFANLRLSQGESFTLDGVTIVNNGTTAINGYTIADAFAKYAGTAMGGGAFKWEGLQATNTLVLDAAGVSSVSGSAVSIFGKFESLTGDWANATLNNQSGGSSLTKLTFDSQVNRDILDLNMTWNANSAVTNNTLPTVAFSTSHNDLLATAVGVKAADGTSLTEFEIKGVSASGKTSIIAINIDGVTHRIAIKSDDGGTAVDAKNIGTWFQTTIIEGGSVSTAVANVESISIDGTVYEGGKMTTEQAAAIQTMFALADGFSYAFTDLTADGKMKIVADPLTGLGTEFPTQKVAFSQLYGTATTDAAVFTLDGFQEESNGVITVDFSTGLLAGYSYSFNGKTIIATKDIDGAKVAEAFTMDVGTYDGVVVATGFDAAKIDLAKATATYDGNVLTIADTDPTKAKAGQSDAGIKTAAESFITGTMPKELGTSMVSGSKVDGQTKNDNITADSYVAFNGFALDDSNLDSIANFEFGKDKLAFKKIDGSNYVADAAGTLSGALSFAAANTITDENGGALKASVSNGIIDFAWTTPDADGVPAITLAQKLFAATHLSGQTNKLAGFNHDGNFYAIGLGGSDTTSNDDIVVKLDGINVTDIATIIGG
ncbi:MAG: hypothetical protein K2F85_08925 [Helicobacter sp.]|nr:hypothetical protein [Helicobacter sp.]